MVETTSKYYLEKGIRENHSLDLGPVIIRTTNWPVETVDKVCSPKLTKGVDAWIEQEESLRLESTIISDVLYAIIPKLEDRALRSKLLSLRRCVYRYVDPIPACLVNFIISSKTVPQELKETVLIHNENRSILRRKFIDLKILYDSSLAEELNELRDITTNHNFLKALYIASPSTFHSVLKKHMKNEDLRITKLDLALYSYLMRAIGRATPNGLWAGVTIAKQTYENEHLIHADWDPPGKVLFYPNLSPFVNILKTMVCNQPWQDKIPLRLNPTLFQISRSAWQFGNYHDGVWRVFQIDDQPIISTLFSLFYDSTTRLSKDIQENLIAHDIVKPAESKIGVNHMVKIGILWSTLEIPHIYNNPWSALEETISNLPSDEKAYWQICLQNLKTISNYLNMNYWLISPTDLQNRMMSALETVNALMNHYGVPSMTEEERVLIADMKSPFNVTVSSDLLSRFEKTLRYYLAFDRYGLGKLETIIDCQRKFSELRATKDYFAIEFVRRNEIAKTGGVQLAKGHIPWEAITCNINKLPTKIKAEEAFKRWNEEVKTVFFNHIHYLTIWPNDCVNEPLMPGSALVLLDISRKDTTFRIGSVTPYPCMFYSRFNSLFLEKHNEIDAFRKWYRESIEKIENCFPKLRFVDLSVRIESNLNAASRPLMTERVLNALDKGIFSKLMIQVDSNHRPRLHIPEDSLTILPYLHSPISIDLADPYSKCLHSVSKLLGRPSLIGSLPFFSSEINEWHHLPRLYLDKSTVISAERWLPDRFWTEKLVKTSGLDRFICWRRFVLSHELPRLVYGKYGSHQTATLMTTDSILVVEHLAKKLKSHGGTYVLSEVFPSIDGAWFRDNFGRHYIAEIAFSWQGEPAFWYDYLRNSY